MITFTSKMLFAILGSFHSHSNFRVNLLIAKKKILHGILFGIALNLVDKFEEN